MPTSTSTHVDMSVHSSMHVLVSTYSTSYPIAKGTYPIGKGAYPIAKDTYPIAKDTYPIAKVMLRKQGSIPK